MNVRDKTKRVSEYKGHRIEAGKGGESCPCLPCFNVHDCGYFRGEHHIEVWDCATRYNSGCPNRLPRIQHIFRPSKRWDNRKIMDVFRCVRCGQKVRLDGDFDFRTEEAPDASE